MAAYVEVKAVTTASDIATPPAPAPQKMEEHVPKNEMKAPTCCPDVLTACLCLLAPGCCCCPQTVTPNTEMVFTLWGKYWGSIREPGCYFVHCCLSANVVSTKKCVVDLKDVKVADFRGNPLIISGIVTYNVRDSQKAVFGTANVLEFVQGQALAVIKKTASLYPYESKDGHSLKGEAEKIRQDMVGMLQERVAATGVHVINFELTDLAYAPEIARNMLVRQQAEALVDARKVVVQGAVEIAYSAITELDRKGIKMSEQETARVVGNLLVAICGESGVQTTMNVSN